MPLSINKVTQEARRTEFGRIAFFLWLMFLGVSSTYGPSNGYRVFVKKLLDKDEDSGFISFNYNVLLDRAIQQVFGTHLGSLDDYLRIKFIKPHGSINWFLLKRDDDPSAMFHEHGLDYGKRYNIASHRMFNGPPIPFGRVAVLRPDAQALLGGFTELVNAFDREYFYPLMFLPLTSKMYDFVEEFMTTILERGKALMQKAEEVYLIGYRARDEIIHEILSHAQKDTVLHVVGRDSAAEIVDYVLNRNSNLTRGNVFDAGFTKFVEGF